MAVDMFLKLAKVDGESQDDKHSGEIDVLSWSWGARQSGTGHLGGGAGAGKAEVADLTITKFVDRASPLLFFLCCSGEHVPNAVLAVRKAGGKNPLEYLKVTLEDVLVTSYETGGASEQDRVVETITLNFARSKLEYVPQKKDGTGAPSITKGWDVAANKEFS